MTPRIVRPHPTEVRARALKADKLVAHILTEADERGISKTDTLNVAAHWTPIYWAAAAYRAKVRMPSADTITSVLAQLARAALIERLANETEPRLSAEYDLRRLELVEP